jgi:hypothetical protein
MAFVIWTFRAAFMEGEKKKEPEENDEDDEVDQSRCCGCFQRSNNELGGFPKDG